MVVVKLYGQGWNALMLIEEEKMAVGNSDHCPLIKQGENMKNRLFTLITALSLGLSVFAGTDMIVKQKNGEEVRFFVEDVEEVFFSDSVPEEVPVVDESETFLEFNILSDSTAEVKEETTIYTGSYKGHSSIVIPAKIRIDGKVYDVVALGDRVFSHNYDLTKITIPSSHSFTTNEKAIATKRMRMIGLINSCNIITINGLGFFCGKTFSPYCFNLSCDS